MDRRLGVGLLLLIVGMILFYSILKLAVSEDNDFKDLMDLSPTELDALRECAPDEVRELEALNSAMTCTLRNERKHSITLLSSYPNGDSDHVRNIYEYTTSLTSFSEYGSIDAHHSLATSYQSGPWELYCRGSPDCNLPIPLWEVPFFVKSDYPTYAVICQHYGFDLPTHDKVIHIVRNPIDAIYGWYSRTNSDEFEFEIQYYVDQYREWQEYWRNYEFKYPYTPFIWFRFEDICYCPEHVLERLLDSTLAPYVNDDLIEAIKTYPCDLYTELGSGLSIYNVDELGYVVESLALYIRQFGYEELVLSMIENHEKTHSEIIETLFSSLYPLMEFREPPTEGYCNRLATNSWHWGGILG